MTLNATARRWFAAARVTLAFLTGALVIAALFYLIPAPSITVAYALASLFTAVLLVCMLQSNMLGSSFWFRLAIAMLIAGCIASSVMPFVKGYDLSPLALLKAVALLAVVAMMRYRQVRSSGKPSCASAGLRAAS